MAGPESTFRRALRLLRGAPRDLADKQVFHQLTMAALLAWVGLGGDALSSSCYGPQESFAVVRGHPHLAIALALATAVTVFVISSAYARLIEVFPNGGGYGVATRLLGPRVGMVSGCALLVDYVLTIAVSVTACGAALFSLIPPETFGGLAARQTWMLAFDFAGVGGLLVLNLRGVKESIRLLAPVFLIFLITHVVLIGGGLLLRLPESGNVLGAAASGFSADQGSIGLGGMLVILLGAYAMGGGTYTGIEAVSNALPLMREPRVVTAQRTMRYMAWSLALTAGGLILCYLLWATPQGDATQTMNAHLARALDGHLGLGGWFVLLVLVSEGALLLTAAQTGFIGGPRVLANMAVDGWMPRRFAALSERLTTADGILIMGVAAIAMVWYASGDVKVLVVVYAVNVFLSFALTMIGMLLLWMRRGAAPWLRARRIGLYALGALLCVIILAFTCWHEFHGGAMLAIIVTGLLAASCLLVRAHYRGVNLDIKRMFSGLEQMPPERQGQADPGPVDPSLPTAVVLVGAWGGSGVHTVLNVLRAFPGHFRQIVFVSVGVLDSGDLKGEEAIEEVRRRTADALLRYRELARRLGLPCDARSAVGIDAVEEAAQLCVDTARDFPRATFFAGKVVFRRERWYHRILHNDTANAVQRRLLWEGKTMVLIPARLE